jgi:hypothetical protein
VLEIAAESMKKATVNSVCECQAKLGAELDEHKHVLRGWARDMRRKRTEVAPAHGIGIDRAVFEVGWLCPFCTRNTLRVFDTGGLGWRDEPTPAATPGG